MVYVEKGELDMRIHDLGSFMQSPTFEALDINEKARLQIQFSLMNSYSAILGARIENFKQEG